MTCIDFNLIVYDYGSESFLGANHVSRSNCVLTDYGLLSAAAVQVVRGSLPRRSSRQDLYVSGTVLLHGLCSTDWPREFTRQLHPSIGISSINITCVKLRLKAQWGSEYRR